MSRPFLILQLRPEDAAADNEFAALLKFGGLTAAEVVRVRLDQQPLGPITLDEYAGVIVGGGPSNVSDDPAKKGEAQRRFEAELQGLLADITARDFPYLGICYGMGILAAHLGGTVSKERYGESVGAVTIHLTEDGLDDPLTAGLPDTFRAFVGHKEASQNLPPATTLLARGEGCPVQLFRYTQNIYGCQFHPELDVEGITLRIGIYRNAGYFPPEDADKLIAAAHAEDVTVPTELLRRFVDRYRTFGSQT